jgi:hypothetical protein
MDLQEEPPYFIYSSKEDYLLIKNKFFLDIQRCIKINDTLYRLIIYLGIKELYKYLKINKLIKLGLNKITQFKQVSWVEDVCWHIFKNVEVAFESLSITILKNMDIFDMEKYLYQLIINSLEGLTTAGFLSFVEEQNIYTDHDPDLVEELLDKESTIDHVPDTNLVVDEVYMDETF